ncbi:MAG: putative RNA methyltransferase [Panacagrimonas sp.]
MPSIICPVCRLPLEQNPKTWRCAQGHSFDAAREGYVNLLLAHQKNSPSPGDSAESLKARREFLQAGHYRPLLDAVLELLRPLRAQNLLDVGCGEGYYTGAMTTVSADVTGLDIAKPAIQMAARSYRDVTWLVGSGAAIPLADASVDVVSNLFTQLHIDEIRRVLKPDSHSLVVTPSSNHLWDVRERLFGEVRAHEPDKFLAGFEASFELRERREIRVDLQLTRQSLRKLLAMTPYVWKARPEMRATLELHESFTTQASFVLMLFRKK